jgi:hypothetical protein
MRQENNAFCIKRGVSPATGKLNQHLRSRPRIFSLSHKKNTKSRTNKNPLKLHPPSVASMALSFWQSCARIAPVARESAIVEASRY